MLDLTDEQKINYHRIMDALVNYWWAELKIKMLIEGLSFEEALEAIKQEINSNA